MYIYRQRVVEIQAQSPDKRQQMTDADIEVMDF